MKIWCISVYPPIKGLVEACLKRILKSQRLGQLIPGDKLIFQTRGRSSMLWKIIVNSNFARVCLPQLSTTIHQANTSISNGTCVCEWTRLKNLLVISEKKTLNPIIRHQILALLFTVFYIRYLAGISFPFGGSSPYKKQSTNHDYRFYLRKEHMNTFSRGIHHFSITSRSLIFNPPEKTSTIHG